MTNILKNWQLGFAFKVLKHLAFFKQPAAPKKNPYSSYDLEGEAAFLEQLVQALSISNMYLEFLEENPTDRESFDKIQAATARMIVLFNIRMEERKHEKKAA